MPKRELEEISSAQAEQKSPTERREYEIIKSVHRAVLFGKTLALSEQAWQGTVKLNKPVIIELWHDNKRKQISFTGDKPIKIGIVQLQDLVRKAIQEGPEDMRVNFYTNDGGKNRCSGQPLSIEILEEELNPNFIAASQPHAGIPRL